jgi:RHS repeat-associated protein
MKQNTLNIENTLYARDANSQVMAIYERDTILNVTDNLTTHVYVTDLKISVSDANYACEYDLILRNYTSNQYSVDEDGTINVLGDMTVQCKYNQGLLTIPAGTKIYRNYFDALQTQKTGMRVYIGNGFMKDTNSYTIQRYGANGTYNAIVSSYVSLPINDIDPRRVKLSEWHIYGNEQQGRFVTRKPESTLYYLANLTNDVINKNFFRVMDKKQYELKDHLGNVRATIGDYKLPFNDATSTRGVAPFFVDEKATNDYYPYGMLISDRSFNSGGSRYGYNGKENDNEVKGINGSQIDYGFRIYDPRIGKFLSVDPLTKSYPSHSPYAYAMNRPIDGIDLDGKEWSSTGIVFNPMNCKFEINYTIKIQVVSDSELLKKQTVMQEYLNKLEKVTEDIMSQQGDGRISDPNVKVDIVFTQAKADSKFVLDLKDNSGINKFLEDNNITVSKGTQLNGQTFRFNDINNNKIIMRIEDPKELGQLIYLGRTLAHELGHTGGLLHPWDFKNKLKDIKEYWAPEKFNNFKIIKDNLLNSGANPINELKTARGVKLTGDQKKEIETNVQKQQKPQK